MYTVKFKYPTKDTREGQALLKIRDTAQHTPYSKQTNVRNVSFNLTFTMTVVAAVQKLVYVLYFDFKSNKKRFKNRYETQKTKFRDFIRVLIS